MEKLYAGQSNAGLVLFYANTELYIKAAKLKDPSRILEG